MTDENNQIEFFLYENWARTKTGQHTVTDIRKFYRRENWFIRTFSASFSYELRTRKRLLQGSGRPEVT